MKVFGKIMLIVGAALLIALAAFVLFALISTANVKLEPEKLHTESAQVQLLASDGETIASPKQYAELETLPPHLPAAFVAVEDKRFYAHGGLDVLRIPSAKGLRPSRSSSSRTPIFRGRRPSAENSKNGSSRGSLKRVIRRSKF